MRRVAKGGGRLLREGRWEYFMGTRQVKLMERKKGAVERQALLIKRLHREWELVGRGGDICWGVLEQRSKHPCHDS